jgi:hypothetical protein
MTPHLLTLSIHKILAKKMTAVLNSHYTPDLLLHNHFHSPEHKMALNGRIFNYITMIGAQPQAALTMFKQCISQNALNGSMTTKLAVSSSTQITLKWTTAIKNIFSLEIMRSHNINNKPLKK